MSVERPEHFHYTRLRVPDVTSSVHFYEWHCGLEVVQREPSAAFLRAGKWHHAIRLVEDRSLKDAVVDGFGYGMADEGSLEALRARVDRAGISAEPLPETAVPYCINGFTFKDVHGLQWDFVTGFFEFAEEPFLAYAPERAMHPFIMTDRYEETVDLFTNVVGMIVSDYIEDSTAFLRTDDRYHHSLAIMRHTSFRLNHINFLMPSLDQVMRGRARAIHAGVPIQTDIVNHSGSASIAFYMVDLRHGPPIELSYGHRILTPEEHESARPRRLARGARNEFDTWRVDDDDWREGG